MEGGVQSLAVCLVAKAGSPPWDKRSSELFQYKSYLDLF